MVRQSNGIADRTTVAVALVVAVAAAGCASDSSGARLAAEALSRAADSCLTDVRDNRLAFERSGPCSSLSSLSDAYIQLGGFTDALPAEIAVVAVGDCLDGTGCRGGRRRRAYLVAQWHRCRTRQTALRTTA